MNKEELFNAIDEKIKQKFGCYIWTEEVNELVSIAQQYTDAQTSELKAEIERLKREVKIARNLVGLSTYDEIKEIVIQQGEEMGKLKFESNSFQDYVRSFIRTHGLDKEWERFLLANPTELPKYHFKDNEFEDL